jgi:hypothetical protein
VFPIPRDSFVEEECDVHPHHRHLLLVLLLLPQ